MIKIELRQSKNNRICSCCSVEINRGDLYLHEILLDGGGDIPNRNNCLICERSYLLTAALAAKSHREHTHNKSRRNIPMMFQESKKRHHTGVRADDFNGCIHTANIY